jgi:hypothetical protein
MTSSTLASRQFSPAGPTRTDRATRPTPDLMGVFDRASGTLVGGRTTDLDRLAALLPEEDRDQFWLELRDALNQPGDALERTLQDWLETARALADPLNREILLGEYDASDFVEVERPE